jgi:2-oxoglutarate dehydrogenase E1 component
MPHRGRLATLVVVNDYPFRNLIYKSMGNNLIPEEITDRICDINTHTAISNTSRFIAGAGNHKRNKVTLSMIHNPSHLECQNAISMGKTKAKQDDFENPRAVMNI